MSSRRLLRFVPRRVRDVVDAFAYRLWQFAFALRGALSPAPASTVVGGDRVVVLAPHPDDEVLGCAGAIMQHVEAGDPVTVVQVTDGRRSRARDVSPEEMAEIRRREADAAAQILGVTDLRRLDLPEGEWDAHELEAALSALFATTMPTLIYAPSMLDFHPEHCRVAAALARSVPADVAVRIVPLQVPLVSLANRRIDVSAQRSRIVRSFEAYATQVSSLLRGLRLRQYAAARCRGATDVEEFCEVSGDEFRRANAEPLAGRPVRGLRFRALSDPLSFGVGRAARHEFADRLRAGVV